MKTAREGTSIPADQFADTIPPEELVVSTTREVDKGWSTATPEMLGMQEPSEGSIASLERFASMKEDLAAYAGWTNEQFSEELEGLQETLADVRTEIDDVRAVSIYDKQKLESLREHEKNILYAIEVVRLAQLSQAEESPVTKRSAGIDSTPPSSDRKNYDVQIAS